MTQEEKELLIKDLCGRLPYGVKIKEEYGDYIDVNIYNANIEHLIDRVVSGLDKLVLRPMSSMTEEERQELGEEIEKDDIEPYGEICSSGVDNLLLSTCRASINFQDYLNENMFDYRNLIEKGLALEAK